MGDDTQNFRLTRVSAIEAELRQERDARVKLYRKYARAVSVIETASVASNAVAVATGAGGGGGGGIGLIASGVGAAAGAALEGIAITCGVISICGRVANRRLNRKAKKHDRIAQAAEAILATVEEITSRALNGSRISHDEFQQVQEQMRRFLTRKELIREEARTSRQKQTAELASNPAPPGSLSYWVARKGPWGPVKIDHYSSPLLGRKVTNNAARKF